MHLPHLWHKTAEEPKVPEEPERVSCSERAVINQPADKILEVILQETPQLGETFEQMLQRQDALLTREPAVAEHTMRSKTRRAEQDAYLHSLAQDAPVDAWQYAHRYVLEEPLVQRERTTDHIYGTRHALVLTFADPAPDAAESGNLGVLTRVVHAVTPVNEESAIYERTNTVAFVGVGVSEGLHYCSRDVREQVVWFKEVMECGPTVVAPYHGHSMSP